MSGPSAREPAGWQAQKSAATRNLIVNATVRCLVEVGYGRTTTQAIASQAGLSRGAMLHHFPLKSDAVRAAVVGKFQTSERVGGSGSRRAYRLLTQDGSGIEIMDVVLSQLIAQLNSSPTTNAVASIATRCT